MELSEKLQIEPNNTLDESSEVYYSDVYSPGNSKERLEIGREVSKIKVKNGTFDTSDSSITTTNNEYTLSIPNPDGEIFTLSISDSGTKTFKIGYFNNSTLAYSTFTTQLQDWLSDFYVVTYSGGTNYNISRKDKTEFSISTPNRTRNIDITGTNALTSSTVTIDGVDYILENNATNNESATDLGIQLNATGLYYILTDGDNLTIARQDSVTMTISIATIPKYTYTITGRNGRPGIGANQTLSNPFVFGYGAGYQVAVSSHQLEIDGTEYKVTNPANSLIQTSIIYSDYEYANLTPVSSSITKNNVRYIRATGTGLYTNGNFSRWFELKAMDGSINRASNSTLTTNKTIYNSTGQYLIDGNNTTSMWLQGSGQDIITMDLGAEYTIDSIFWKNSDTNGSTSIEEQFFNLEISDNGVDWYGAKGEYDALYTGGVGAGGGKIVAFPKGEFTSTLSADSYNIYSGSSEIYANFSEYNLPGALLVNEIYKGLPSSYIKTNANIYTGGHFSSQTNDFMSFEFRRDDYSQISATNPTAGNTLFRYNNTTVTKQEDRNQLVVGPISADRGQEVSYIFTEDANEQTITDTEYTQITGSLSNTNQNFYIPTQSYPKLIQVNAVNSSGESNGTRENKVQKCTRKTGSTTEFVEDKVFKTDTNNSGTIEQVKRGGFVIALDTNGSNNITWSCTS